MEILGGARNEIRFTFHGSSNMVIQMSLKHCGVPDIFLEKLILHHPLLTTVSCIVSEINMKTLNWCKARYLKSMNSLCLTVNCRIYHTLNKWSSYKSNQSPWVSDACRPNLYPVEPDARNAGTTNTHTYKRAKVLYSDSKFSTPLHSKYCNAYLLLW